MLFKRDILRPLHLFLGLASGLVVFILSITGCLYCFNKEIKNWVYADLYYVSQTQSSAQSLQTLLKAAEIQFPDSKVKSIMFKKDPLRSVEINFNNGQSVFVNPYTAKILGTQNKDHDFFKVVLKIHKNLGLGKLGSWIIRFSTLFFVFMLVSGIILWWPVNKRVLKQKFTMKLKAPPPKRNYDLHNVLGFYASWILLLVGLTGLIYSFSWAEKAVYIVTRSGRSEVHHTESVWQITPKGIPMDKIAGDLTVISQEFKEFFLRIPNDSSGVVKAYAMEGRGWVFKRQSTFDYDQYTGERLSETLFEEDSLGDKIVNSNTYLHTGESFGFFGKLLIFLACLISASLPVTGFMMWWGKRKRKG